MIKLFSFVDLSNNQNLFKNGFKIKKENIEGFIFLNENKKNNENNCLKGNLINFGEVSNLSDDILNENIILNVFEIKELNIFIWDNKK
jgi:hypothetical protein